MDHHETVVIEGSPIDATWMRECAGALLAERQAEADRIAAEATPSGGTPRSKLVAGFDPYDLLIEKLRSRFDLGDVLRFHGYDKSGTKYRHPNSSSGSYGPDIKVFGGIERVSLTTPPIHYTPATSPAGALASLHSTPSTW